MRELAVFRENSLKTSLATISNQTQTKTEVTPSNSFSEIRDAFESTDSLRKADISLSSRHYVVESLCQSGIAMLRLRDGRGPV